VLSGTLDDGMVIVNATKDDKIQLVFDGVNISNSTGCAVFVASADKVFVTLADGTTNTLSDGATYSLDADNDEPYAALFSKDDLTINGSGSLTVNGNYQHGICSKDDLRITGGDITVTSVADAIRGRDSLAILDGTFTINSGEDAIKSNNDEDLAKGYVSIDGGTYTINAGDDAIHGESWLRVSEGDIAIAKCYEGLEATQVYVNGGNISIVASDDGINAAGGMLANSTNTGGGAGDFAEGAGGGRGMGGGKFDGADSSDPSANASKGADAQSNQTDATSSATKTTSFAVSNTSDTASDSPSTQIAAQTGIGAGGGISSDLYKIEINGGYISVMAAGDAIDSNGSAVVNGGTLLISCSSNNADEALDYELSGTLNGGTVVLIGPTGMSGGFSNASQAFIYTRASGKAGDNVTLANTDGAVLVTMQAQSSFTTVCISTPEIVDGTTYNLVIGGTVSDSTLDINGFAVNGKVSGGTSTEVTATTSSSSTGGMGGAAGMGGGKMGARDGNGNNNDEGDGQDFDPGSGDFDGGDMPEAPDDSDSSDVPQMPDGNAPDNAGRGGAGFGPRTNSGSSSGTQS
jgi:hypothetical protein